jgi:hypothetical protein
MGLAQSAGCSGEELEVATTGLIRKPQRQQRRCELPSGPGMQRAKNLPELLIPQRLANRLIVIDNRCL